MLQKKLNQFVTYTIIPVAHLHFPSLEFNNGIVSVNLTGETDLENLWIRVMRNCKYPDRRDSILYSIISFGFCQNSIFRSRVLVLYAINLNFLIPLFDFLLKQSGAPGFDFPASEVFLHQFNISFGNTLVVVPTNSFLRLTERLFLLGQAVDGGLYL